MLTWSHKESSSHLRLLGRCRHRRVLLEGRVEQRRVVCLVLGGAWELLRLGQLLKLVQLQTGQGAHAPAVRARTVGVQLPAEAERGMVIYYWARLPKLGRALSSLLSIHAKPRPP